MRCSRSTAPSWPGASRWGATRPSTTTRACSSTTTMARRSSSRSPGGRSGWNNRRSAGSFGQEVAAQGQGAPASLQRVAFRGILARAQEVAQAQELLPELHLLGEEARGPQQEVPAAQLLGDRGQVLELEWLAEAGQSFELAGSERLG